MSSLETIESHLCFGGQQRRYRHQSAVLGCSMNLSVYLPPQAASCRVPALYWLSGLTCTDENFTFKAGAQRIAAELGVALIMPDTSPRGTDLQGRPVADSADYDLGQGAGFYLNATRQPWSAHYRMYDYILDELPAVLEDGLPLDGRRSISGHSMGGHGALVLGLRNPERYRSISAFAPIVHPSDVPWGQKAFTAYLGDHEDNRQTWSQYDAYLLMMDLGCPRPVLVDQGDADSFLASQLKTDLLVAAAQQTGTDLRYRVHAGYDHSYYFIASLIEDHLNFHAGYLLAD